LGVSPEKDSDENEADCVKIGVVSVYNATTRSDRFWISRQQQRSSKCLCM